MPSNAAGCHGRPPVVAYPQLLHRPLPFLPHGEFELFQLDRVCSYLSQFTWLRTVGKTGQIYIGGHHQAYSVGRSHAGKTVFIRFDPLDLHLVFYLDLQLLHEIQRRPLRNLTFSALSGLDSPTTPSFPIQLPLPFPLPGG